MKRSKLNSILSKKLKTEEDQSINEYKIKFKNGLYPTYLAYENNENNKNSIKFSDLVDPNHLSKAFMSSFQIDFDWLSSHLPSKSNNPNFNLCLVTHYDSQSDVAGSYTSKEGWLLIKPALERKTRGSFSWSECMHAKLMLLIYPTFLRVVIGTANLIEIDWNFIQNINYINDLPILKEQYENDIYPKAKSISLLKIEHFLKTLNVSNSIFQSILKYDWDYFNAEIVLSIPGKFKNVNWNDNQSDISKIMRYGLHGLKDIIFQKFPNTLNNKNVYCLTSSLGNVRPQFLDHFRASISNLKSKPNIYIIFPTQDYVKTSTLGPELGGTICFNSNFDQFYPKKLLHEYNPKVKGSLGHAKMILSLDQDGWYYCGSHNFTQAAWGNPFLDSISINNYEIGVVLPYKTELYCPFHMVPQPYKVEDRPWIRPT